MRSSNPLAQWVEQLQSRGKYVFTREQVETATGRSFVGVQAALRRLKDQGRVTSPRRGFFVVVPPEYRTSGAPPASWFIDALMKYLGQPYYVGLLTAASFYGAAHQQPLVFQVMTSKPTREARAGRTAIRFVMNSRLERFPVSDRPTDTGTMRVSTPETTAFDLVRYPTQAGRWSNTATVLSELGESLDGARLADVAPLVQIPDVQRLGYLLEAVGRVDLADPLADWLADRLPRPVPLNPRGPQGGSADARWRVRPNFDVEVDV